MRSAGSSCLHDEEHGEAAVPNPGRTISSCHEPNTFWT